MQHDFPKPASLRHVVFDRKLHPEEILPLGLYRCLLSGPTTDFIRDHNPFRVFYSGRRLMASLSEPVEIDLNEFELAYYRRHFQHIHLIDAALSDDTIQHPLAKEALRSFARRKNFRSQGNKPLADREKFLATLLSSCTDRPRRMRRLFRSQDEAMEHLRVVFGIQPRADEPEMAIEKWIRRGKSLTVTEVPGGVAVEAIDINSGSACFMLGQRIVARGRTILLEMMERIISSAPGAEICYANIDSIHFSLPTSHLREVMDALRAQASDDMGSFKIEAITRHGLWLEPGRYWLYSDVVEKFRNRGIGNRTDPFKDHAIHVISRQIDLLHVPIRVTLRMDRSMSDVRTLDAQAGSPIIRQRMIEAGRDTKFDSVLGILEHNRQHASPTRMMAFKDLERRLATPPPCQGAK
jgi:hypothetical protein